MEQIKLKKNIFDAILNVFAWVCLFIALFVSITVVCSTFSGTDNGKSVFGYKMLIIEGDSMTRSASSMNEPIFFEIGDVIIIKEVTDFSTIAVNDVITFVSHNPDSLGKTITHKVRDIKTNSNGDIIGFETYGISTGTSDQAIVEPSTIIGKYTSKISNLGHVFAFLKKPAGYFSSILVPCLLIIIFFSIKVGKLIAKRELAEDYFSELNILNNRILDLEKTKDGMVMQDNVQKQATETNVENEPVKKENANTGSTSTKTQHGYTQNVFTQQPYTQPYAQPQQVYYQPMPYYVYPAPMPAPNYDKALELTVNSLNTTIATLTRTIENLAGTVEKPIDSLVRTVETLAGATAKPSVVEKIVEKVVEVPVEKIVEKVVEVPVEKIVEVPVILEATQKTNQVIENEQVKEEQAVSEVVATAEPTSIFDEFNATEKVSFSKKLLSLDAEIKGYFSEIHNELISYKKVHYRISFKGVSYRLGRDIIAKIIVRGKTLKLHLALNVEEYPKTVYFQEDSSNVKIYEDIPFTVKIKSNRGKNNAIKLISSLAEKFNLAKNEQFKPENILKELKSFK